jgi:hypothetical protein
MKWQDIRQIFPDKWVLIEAIEAYTTEEHFRIVEQLSLIDAFSDFFDAMDMYKHIKRQMPQRELFVVHTQKEELEIKVRYRFLRIRDSNTPITGNIPNTQLPNYALRTKGAVNNDLPGRFQ